MNDTNGRASRWLRVTIPALIVVAIAIVALIVVVLTDDDGEVSTSPTTTSGAPTTTSTSTTTSTTSTTTTTMPSGAADTAVWPAPGSGIAVTDPVEAARRFATEFVGFSDPVLGGYQGGDSRSGEVEVRPRAGGPVTTILLRQLGTDGSWSVLGTATANIEVDEPAGLATIANPVRLSGRAFAFEGNVAVDIRADDGTILATNHVTGRGDQMGPFASELGYAAPPTERGAVLFRTYSAENGQVWEAGVVRVRFPPT